MAYSRYGGRGKGLTDRGSRSYARRLRQGSAAHRNYTTFVTKGGARQARGSWQTIGHTAGSLGYSSFASGKGMTRGVITGDTGLSAYEFASKFQEIGKTGTGERLFLPRVVGRTTPGSSALASKGIITQQGAPVSFASPLEAVFKGVADPAGNRGSGGWLAMLRGKGGGLGIPPAEDKGGLSGATMGLVLIILKVLT